MSEAPQNADGARATLHEFLLAEVAQRPSLASLVRLLEPLAGAVEQIAAHIAQGALASEPKADDPANPINVQGEVQKPLDRLTNTIILSACESCGVLAGMVSEELEEMYDIPAEHGPGEYLLSFDPLDGSSNTDIDVTMGTIFSVLQREGGAGKASVKDFLQAGDRQVCAGYALYGPQTMLVLTLGRGVHGFTLDPKRREFVLTHPKLRIPESARELAINVANEPYWEPPVDRYIAECMGGRAGPRQADFVVRWIGAMVVEVHRILIRGGIYLYPKDSKSPPRAGRLRLLYEVSPMSFLVEQAGGLATTGHHPLLEMVPTSIHQRAPVILGSREEVERVILYHREPVRDADEPYRHPLFGHRSLFTRP